MKKEARVVYRGGKIFDGQTLWENHALVMDGDRIFAFLPDTNSSSDGELVDLDGDILCPGFVDLQVNGGGGVQFNDAPGVETLDQMASAHRSLGATTILPTLISDTPEQTAAAIAAVKEAIAAGLSGIAGLHLEGPHLAAGRKGAHDPAHLRSMTDQDLDLLIDAARELPALMITLAPERASIDQVAQIAQAGAIVSLGHSEASFGKCLQYAGAGARCVTHLFNAMGRFHHRDPGLVGAALSSRMLWAGLIADGIHVHPEVIRTAWAAKKGPGEIFLVSDSMACAGTDMPSFELGGRRVERRDGQLTLIDGTLAGADLELCHAVNVLIHEAGVETARALRAATAAPARILTGRTDLGRLTPGSRPPVIRLSPDLMVRPESEWPSSIAAG